MKKDKATEAAARPTGSRLGCVTSGPQSGAIKFVLHGPGGVGKSTLAASVPNVIFVDCERSTKNLDCARYSFRDEVDGYVPRSYQEVLAAIEDLTGTDHPYKTLAIDGLDRLESLIWQWMLERDSGKVTPYNRGAKPLLNIESYGFGRGYKIAVDEWRNLARRLDRLAAKRGMNLMLIGHSVVRTYKSPETDDYDRYELRVDMNAGGFLKEWADIVGFLSFEDVVKTPDGALRAKAYSTGRRVLRLQREAAFDAKTRIPLPPEIEIGMQDPWGPIGEAIEASVSMPAETIETLIEQELVLLADEKLTETVRAAVKEAHKSQPLLMRYLAKLQQRTAKKTPDTKEVQK